MKKIRFGIIRPLITLSLFPFVLVSSACAQTIVAESHFETGREGWNTDGLDIIWNMTPSWRNSGGNPGGFLFGRQKFGLLSATFSAPTPFLGDQSLAYGGSLSFDLQEGSGFSDTGQVQILSNTGVTLIRTLGGIPASWDHFHLELTPGDGWLTGDGNVPTPSEMRQSLGDISNLLIGFASSPSVAGQFGLDNVVLSTAAAAPEPGTLPLAGVSLSLFWLAHRRRTGRQQGVFRSLDTDEC